VRAVAPLYFYYYILLTWMGHIGFVQTFQQFLALRSLFGALSFLFPYPSFLPISLASPALLARLPPLPIARYRGLALPSLASPHRIASHIPSLLLFYSSPSLLLSSLRFASTPPSLLSSPLSSSTPSPRLPCVSLGFGFAQPSPVVLFLFLFLFLSLLVTRYLTFVRCSTHGTAAVCGLSLVWLRALCLKLKDQRLPDARGRVVFNGFGAYMRIWVYAYMRTWV
jgi:hypothetical protein